MSSNPDACVPKVLTDFVFDLYDSVTISQLPEEQTKLYTQDFVSLNAKYFGSSPWPSPQSIANECNGHPLFLALYRELTLRHSQTNARPSLRDRIEGFNVYKELFEEIIEGDSFFLISTWVFDMVHEFVYQFQGFCQVRSAIMASARKHSLNEPSQLLDNVRLLQKYPEAWDVQAVYGYLHKLIQLGGFSGKAPSINPIPVYVHLGLFASIALSRLECLMGDYTASLQALDPILVHLNRTTTSNETVGSVLQSVLSARVSMAYHAGVSFAMLRRYRDAIGVLGEICSVLQQRRNETFTKQYERMTQLLVLLAHVCPNAPLDEGARKTLREKYGSRLESGNFEEFVNAGCTPKFVAIGAPNFHRQQVSLWLHDLHPHATYRTLRSYLKLYTSLPVNKLANFYDQTAESVIPLVLSYKLRLRQVERSGSYSHGQPSSALDINYYILNASIHIDEVEKQRRFENYFYGQIAQNLEIRKDVVAIDTRV